MDDGYDERLSVEENIARGLFAIAGAIREAGRSIGCGGATPGALEFIGMQLRDGVAVAARVENENDD